MHSPAAPLCARLACRIVVLAVVLLVTLGGLRLLAAAEPPAAVEPVPTATADTSAALGDAGPLRPRARDLRVALRRALITCGGPVCGFDRIPPLLRPAWRTEAAPASPKDRSPAFAWVGEVGAPGPRPLDDLLVLRIGGVTLRPLDLAAVF